MPDYRPSHRVTPNTLSEDRKSIAAHPTGNVITHFGQGALAAASIVWLVAVAACSAGGQRTPTAAPASPTSVPEPESALPTPPTGEASGLRVVLASTDLGVGRNRLAFGIIEGAAGQVRASEAKVLLFHVDTTTDRPRTTALAPFVPWPGGRQGVYVANVELDAPGQWGIVAEIVGADGAVRSAQSGVFQVKPETSSPAIGSAAPASVTRTSGDVPELAELTTSPDPDPDLYLTTVADAVSSGRPSVITFATPAFCRTATCGPQVEIVSALREKFAPRANFLHVEVFENAHEIDGDASKLRLDPAMAEWGLLTEPFTFVVDGGGLVASKFEGFVTEGELEAALAAVLGQ